MNPQFLNYDFTLPFQAPTWLENAPVDNGMMTSCNPGLGSGAGNGQPDTSQNRFLGGVGGGGKDGSQYAMQNIVSNELHYGAEYQQPPPAMQQQSVQQHPAPTLDSGTGLGLDLNINGTPTASVFRPAVPPPPPATLATTIAAAAVADHLSLLSATAALTLPDNPAALKAKAPDPSLRLGKRRFVSLRVYHDGELGFQRKVVR